MDLKVALDHERDMLEERFQLELRSAERCLAEAKTKTGTSREHALANLSDRLHSMSRIEGQLESVNAVTRTFEMGSGK